MKHLNKNDHRYGHKGIQQKKVAHVRYFMITPDKLCLKYVYTIILEKAEKPINKCKIYSKFYTIILTN